MMMMNRMMMMMMMIMMMMMLVRCDVQTRNKTLLLIVSFTSSPMLIKPIPILSPLRLKSNPN
ncbi:unnamed protein product [Echinostoma caproni]|uniref:Secreted protein n=1 Tax=Echinostoma caproni TaxID=27848 RepID=A0A183AJY7_9TREM|nr:unnamed protein product [Echinostoma caproni]